MNLSESTSLASRFKGSLIGEGTSLDSIFKSRDITLPTKVHLVKAMVFPVVMYGCESWTIKIAEMAGWHHRLDGREFE